MQLLVSVRNVEEALIAAEFGADIVDIKDPDAGPLGFAGATTIADIVTVIGRRVPVSAALGECSDWLTSSAVADFPTDVMAELQFLKLGLAGLQTPTAALSCAVSDLADLQTEAASSWETQWSDVRQRFVSASKDSATNIRRPAWVAVAYADAARAAAPSPPEVLEAGFQSGCSTLLIDTFCKDGRGTLCWLEEDEVIDLRTKAHQYGMKFALAGQLSSHDLPAVCRIRPDIFAVRGAVCAGNNRRSAISGELITDLKRKILACDRSSL